MACHLGLPLALFAAAFLTPQAPAPADHGRHEAPGFSAGLANFGDVAYLREDDVAARAGCAVRRGDRDEVRTFAAGVVGSAHVPGLPGRGLPRCVTLPAPRVDLTRTPPLRR